MAAKGFAKFIIVLTTVSAAVMELIDTSIVNVALSDMAGSLGVSIEDVSWVITAYAIANVIIIPLTGFLAEYFGRKRYYLVSMIVFTLASYMCAESGSLMEIIIWRFVQGIGGGALLSTSQAILFDAFEPKDRPIAAGLFGMGLVLGPTLGPTLGGYLIEHFSWPMIFMINLPIGIIATILTYTYIEKKPNEGKNRKNIHIDYNGILLLAAGIGCLQYVLERGETDDWFSSETIRICAIVAAVTLVLFVWYELRIKNPAVNLRVLGDRNLAFTTIFTFVTGLGLFTSVFVYPVLAQRVLGYTAYETGLALLAPTMIGVLMMPIIGKSMAKGVPAVRFVVVGLVLFAAYCWLTARVSPEVGISAFFFPLALRAFGISMVQLPLINQAVAGLQPKDYPAGIALNNMIRQLGGAFGIALANTYISHRYAQHRSDLVANITDGAALVTQRTTAIAQGIISKTGADINTATHTAHAMISSAVDRQAYYLSYLDTFRLIALFFIIVLPLAVFLKTKKKSAEEEAAARAAVAESH
ncbi:MFS transporter, DHA2 family, multidrug resistance protein [Filimonas lacunae]|uniref:MFS transporter, DHA2 family, multidrug resistance protein n=1 Tax=Filimonas lacunae TaxID=477680 RepID=A0A173ML99_9BACT|nr:DHA2 family efflux MFS transporter permease subunit [Filimonas lacunae]BAV08257.1 inner membrane component of tripartite multidrug resistance system [Filimonas lacunae]SIT33184.1 MFS transporter, DHA2 family, multidrug resistance protein [Filimonas lacunae]